MSTTERSTLDFAHEGRSMSAAIDPMPDGRYDVRCLRLNPYWAWHVEGLTRAQAAEAIAGHVTWVFLGDDQ